MVATVKKKTEGVTGSHWVMSSAPQVVPPEPEKGWLKHHSPCRFRWIFWGWFPWLKLYPKMSKIVKGSSGQTRAMSGELLEWFPQVWPNLDTHDTSWYTLFFFSSNKNYTIYHLLQKIKVLKEQQKRKGSPFTAEILTVTSAQSRCLQSYEAVMPDALSTPARWHSVLAPKMANSGSLARVLSGIKTGYFRRSTWRIWGVQIETKPVSYGKSPNKVQVKSTLI